MPRFLKSFQIFILYSVSFFWYFQYGSNSLLAQSSSRIESEYKLAVPEEQAEELWHYLQTTFSNIAIKEINPGYGSFTSVEIFVDQYFDNPDDILYEKLAGVRFRERYVTDSLVKKLVQIKLSGRDTANVAREEIKFNPYEKIKKGDRRAMHPFWRHIRPKNREEVDLHLSAFQITGDDLKPSVKVQQERRRVYIMENGEALMTITLDRVRSYYFPYPGYTEMELELNEIRYTTGDTVEKKRMEALNKKIKTQILASFPALEQDQTPKYNKMHNLLKNNWLFWVYDNLMYVLLGGILGYAGFLLVLEEQRRQQFHSSEAVSKYYFLKK